MVPYGYMSLIKKVLFFLKKRKYLYGIVAVVLIVGGIFLFKNGKTIDETIIVRHTDFTNQVSVSGKVVAADDVNLGFKNTGTVDRVYFSVGQEIKAGTTIAKIDAKDAEKNLKDAEISLASAKLDLEKIKLQNSSTNLNSDLAKAYSDGFTVASDSFLDFLPIQNGLEDLFASGDLSDNSTRIVGATAVGYRNQAEDLYYKAKNSYDNNLKIFRLLNRNSEHSDIENIINKTYETAKLYSDAVKSMKNFVDYMSRETNSGSDFLTMQNTLVGYASTASDRLASLSTAQINIKKYTDVFQNTDINIQNAILAIDQKENAVQDAKNALEDYYIRAPFDGVITKIDAKIGELTSANEPLVSMIGAGVFQIESYVPEVNIAQIKLGDEANVTLDAYGETVPFYAKVISIDPAETIRDGVSTYKTKFQFSEKDDRIKSGMTANVLVTTFNKPNTIVVPGGVVFDKNGKKFVQIKNDEKIIDREVFLGSVSSLGQVEVISGLADGEMVILNPKIK